MSGYIGPAPVPQATQTREAFTATSGQTTFNTGGYTAGFIDVFMNGVKLAAADYTATNGSDVVLASGAATGDIIETVAYSAFTVADQDFTGETTAEDLTVTGAFTSQGIDDNANATAITIDSSENVGIGTSSPASKIHLQNASGGSGGYLKVTDAVHGGDVRFGMADGVNNDAIAGVWSNNNFSFYTNSSERMRIDSSGNLLVGKTSSAFGTQGIELQSDGELTATKDGTPIYVNRLTTDGAMQNFYKDGSIVGSIGTNASQLFVAAGDTGLQYNGTADQIRPCNGSGAARDAAVDLGDATRRFKDLYLSGGVYLGGTGSANKLDDYEEGTWTPSIVSGSGSTSNESGIYTKVGNVVTISGVFALTGADSTTSIGTLPFTPKAYGSYTNKVKTYSGITNIVFVLSSGTANMGIDTLDGAAVGTFGGGARFSVTYISV